MLSLDDKVNVQGYEELEIKMFTFEHLVSPWQSQSKLYSTRLAYRKRPYSVFLHLSKGVCPNLSNKIRVD